MNIVFNDEKIKVESDCNLINLLQKFSLNDYQGLAVAINEKVVARATWQSVKLNDGDRILVITATQGG